MRVFTGSSQTPISCDTDRIESALCYFRLPLERHLTYPDIPRAGLSPVLDSAGMRIASALGECGRKTDGEAFAQLLFQVRDLVSSESSPSIDTDWQTAVAELLSHVETLLVTIYLPLDHEIAAASRKSKRMSREEAFPKIKDFLLTHPNAKREQVAKAVGCSTGMVQQAPAWQRKVAFHKCEKTQLKKVGLAFADEEKSLEVHRQTKLEMLQDQQSLDDESDYTLVE